MKIYVGNVTLDTSLKLSKQKAEALGQYLIPYRGFNITIFDCIVKIDDLVIDACNPNFNLESFLKNLYKNSNVLVELINKYLALKELTEIDFYSLEKYRKEMENLIFSLKPVNPLDYASNEKCDGVFVYDVTTFVGKDEIMDFKEYLYRTVQLYVPKSINGDFSCFVKNVAKTLGNEGIYVYILPSKIVFETGYEQVVTVYQTPNKEPIPLDYAFALLVKLSRNKKIRHKFVRIAKKLLGAYEKKESLEKNLLTTKRKIESIIKKSAGINEP